MDQLNLKKATAISILWTILRAATDQVFSFAVFLILARLLPKSDIGLFAIAFIFAEAGRIIATGGLLQLVARQTSLQQSFLNAAFWSNVGIAVLYAGLVAVAAPWAGGLLHQPELAPILRLLSIAVVINALGATHMALRLREFGHKTIALRSALAGVIGGSVAVGAALAGFGVWSLVIQRLVVEVVGTILSWAAYRWSPSFELSLSQVASNFRFGSDLAAAQLIFLFIVRVQDLFIGASLGAAAVGTYRVAWRFTEVFAIGAIQPFASVALQTLSRVHGDAAAFRRAYCKLLETCSLLSLPVLVGYGVLSDPLVLTLFGSKWQVAGELGHVFALMAVPFTLNFFASPALSAVGDSRSQRLLAIVQLVSTAAITWLTVRFGLFWVAIGYVTRAYLTLPLQMHLLERSTGVSVAVTWRAIRAPFLASLGMGLGLVLLRLLVGTFTVPWLAASILGGGACYAGLIAILAPDLRRQAFDRILVQR